MKIISFIILSVLIKTGFSESALLPKGELVSPNHFNINIKYTDVSFDKKYIDRDTFSFSSPEARNRVEIPLKISYTLSSGEEFSIKLPYIKLEHILNTGNKLQINTIGDISLEARSMARVWGQLQGVLGIGVIIPTGKSIFDIGNTELPTGNGNWEATLSFSTIDKRGKIIFYGYVSYHLVFPFKVNSVLGNSINDAKISWGHKLFWGVSTELVTSKSVSLVGEFTGKIIYSRSSSYERSGLDANSDINTLASPEFPLQYRNEIYFTPFIQLKLSTTIVLSGGYSIPIKIVNGYAGNYYILTASISL